MYIAVWWRQHSQLTDSLKCVLSWRSAVLSRAQQSLGSVLSWRSAVLSRAQQSLGSVLHCNMTVTQLTAVSRDPHTTSNRDPRSTRQYGYKHTFCQNVVSTTNCLSLYFRKNVTCRSAKDRPCSWCLRHNSVPVGYTTQRCHERGNTRS